MYEFRLRSINALCFLFLALHLGSSAAAQGAAPAGLEADDWASIRAAYDAGRHSVRETEGGFEARNPGQRWRVIFDTRGFLVEPEQSEWSWGLELVSYGFEDSELYVGDMACSSAEGGRVAYSWDDGIEEWYINDTRGFEHGFTVHERPTSRGAERGALKLELHVRGDLAPHVQANPRGIAFLDTQGASVVTYSGLTVFDADGRTLDAWFEESGTGLFLSVDEVGASYPLTIDPVAQGAYLKASNAEAGDSFGQSVSVSGDTIVVGAVGEDSHAVGANGDESDNSVSASGAVYVFTRSGTSWSQEAYLKASNGDAFDSFGYRVGLSGDTLVVTARFEDSGAVGVGGDESDNSESRAGAAYVFTRLGTAWTQVAYLKASNSEADDLFGESVGISGDVIVVGAMSESSSSAGVNGVQGDNSLSDSGAAYVFTRTGTVWSQEAYLKASVPGPGDGFGVKVGASGDTVVVGAWMEDSQADGVNGNDLDNSAPQAGAAYVFRRNGTSWSQEAYLKASNSSPGDTFGRSVGISGDTIVVGAAFEDSLATGVNGNQSITSSNVASDSGAAYVFTRSGTTWAQEAYLKSSNTAANDSFGWSVAISGNLIVTGAIGEQSMATGVNGDESDNAVQGAGAAYVFARTGTNWRQVSYLKSFSTGVNDLFGRKVSVSADTIVVGAQSEDSAATGLNGDPTDNSASGAGAAYVFNFVPDLYPEFCNGDGGDQIGCTNCPCMNNASAGTVGGCLNSAATSARLLATGDASVSLPSMDTSDLRFSLAGAPTGAFCILSSGDSVAPGGMANPCFGLDSGIQAMQFDGLRCAIMNTRRHGGRSANTNGEVGVTNSPWGGEGGPNLGVAQAGGGFVAGQTRFFQVINRDDPLASCMRGLNTSQAIMITFEP